MATIKQIEANRLNGQKSTGPRSAEGKLRSSQNALKSGINAESQARIRGPFPSHLPRAARELISPLKYDQSAPHGRAYASGSNIFYRLQRRMDCAERSYQRALRELQVAQASACEAVAQVPDLRPPIGFVPQKSAEPIFSLAPPSRDLTLPYTLIPAHLFKTPYRGFPK